MASKSVGRPPLTSPSCTRCGKRDAAPGSDHWCLECRAEYQRNYRSADAVRAFAQGVKAMRDYVAAEYEHHPTVFFSGSEIARQVRNAPGPNQEAAPEAS